MAVVAVTDIRSPGTGQAPERHCRYIDGKGPTLKGEQIAEEFQALVESYVTRTYARRAG